MPLEQAGTDLAGTVADAADRVDGALPVGDWLSEPSGSAAGARIPTLSVGLRRLAGRLRCARVARA